MTERLYLLDSMLRAFDATVVSCEPVKDGYFIELDQSAFFPNKGGQPCDVGTIGDATVSDVNEQGERLLHRADRAIPVGAAVHCELDFARRFDIMQQHTGEHLLSYCAWHLFGAQNVGFHCALSYATLDLDKPVGHEGITEIEPKTRRSRRRSTGPKRISGAFRSESTRKGSRRRSASSRSRAATRAPAARRMCAEPARSDS